MTYQTIESKSLRVSFIELPKQTADDLLVEIYFPAGFLYAPHGKQEVPHLLEHYLCKSLSSAGIEASGNTNMQFISFSAFLPKENFSAHLRSFLGGILNNPMGDKQTFRQEQKILLNELAGVLDDPTGLAHRVAMNNRVVHQQPYMTSIDVYQKITLTDLASYYHSHCLSANARLFVGIHKTDQKIQAKVAQTLRSFPPGKIIAAPSPKTASLSKSLTVTEHTEIRRAHLNLTWPAPTSLSDPTEQIAMLLILDLLSKQNEGLLWSVLQDQTGLIYDLDGRVDSYLTFGFLSISTACMPKDIQTCQALILEQVERIKTNKYPDPLFQELKRKNLEESKQEWARKFGRFDWVKTDILERGKVYSLKDWEKAYKIVDKEYTAEIANRYLNKDHLNIILVRDAKK